MQTEAISGRQKEEGSSSTAAIQNLSESSSNSTPKKKESEKAAALEVPDKPLAAKRTLLISDVKSPSRSEKVEEDAGKNACAKDKTAAGKTRPAAAKARHVQPKKEIGKIGGSRGKLGIAITEEDSNKEESKDEIKENEGKSLIEDAPTPDESTIVAGHNSSSMIEPHGTAEQGVSKEPALDELSRLYSKLEKSKNLTAAAKVASELELLLAKFKGLSVSSPEPEPEPSSEILIQQNYKTCSKKAAPLINTALDKGKKVAKAKPVPVRKGLTHNEKAKASKQNVPPDKKKARAKNYQSEVLTEEMKQKVYELYGDDVHFEDIQLQLATAINEDKRSKSATPNKSAAYKEVVLKLHNKVVQKQKESEADILKRIIERQKKAQEQRKMRSLERQQQLAKRNKERLQQVKERQAEMEAEKQKQFAENEQRLQSADVRYEKHINSRKSRARAEGEKVEEVLFLKDAEMAGKKALMDSKLSDSSDRRKTFIEQTKQRQDVVGQRLEMAEKRRTAMQEEQKLKLLQSQQRREDADARRKEKIDQKRIAAEEVLQRAAQAGERKKQLYDEVMSLYTYLCKKENLWECLETGIQWRNRSDVDLSKLTPFERIKRKLLQDYELLVLLPRH